MQLKPFAPGARSCAGGRLLLLSAHDTAGILQLLDSLSANGSIPTGAANEAVDQSSDGLVRLAIVSADSDTQHARILRARKLLSQPNRQRIHDPGGIYFESDPLTRHGGVAALFPGESSQYPGALADLTDVLPGARAIAELQADRAETMWSFFPAIATVVGADLVFIDFLSRLGLVPDAFVGHSAGEIAALIAAGSIDATDAAQLMLLAADLGQLASSGIIERLPRVELLAAGAPADALAKLLAGLEPPVQPAMLNCPHQTVLVAADDIAAVVRERLSSAGILFEALEFHRPYHTALFEDAAAVLGQTYERWITRSPQVAVYSCATTAPLPRDVAGLRAGATGQWTVSVRFGETIQAMYRDGARIFVESGLRGNLSAFVDDILRGQPHAAIPLNVPHRSGPEQLLHAAAQLAIHGLPLRLDVLDVPAKKPLTAAALSGHMHYMAAFLSLQESVMKAYLERRRSLGAFVPARANAPLSPVTVSKAAVQRDRVMPLISRVESRSVDELQAVCEVKLDDAVLRDHTFSRDVSAYDSALCGLPVMPLTLSLELMAEAAALLRPDELLVGIADVQARRWAAADDDLISLRVSVRRKVDGSFAASVFDHVAGGAIPSATPIAEATLRFAAVREAAPAPTIDPGLRPASVISGERLYGEYLFHGPSFRGTQIVDQLGETSAASRIEILPRDDLLASAPDPQFLIDPVQLDQAGQLLWCWFFFGTENKRHILPVRIEAIQIFGSPLEPGTVTRAYFSNPRLDPAEVGGDIDLCDALDRVHLRVKGWRSRTFELPQEFLKLLLRPREATLGERIDLFADQTGWGNDFEIRQIRRSAYPDAFFQNNGQIWLRTLANTVLSRAERRVWRSMSARAGRRIEWLLGRVAAKDAVRSCLALRHGLSLHPADVEIQADARGRPVAGGAWLRDDLPAPVISISHCRAVVMAVAASNGPTSIGIDVEQRDRVNDDVRSVSFSPEEQRSIAELPEPQRSDLALSLWCTREASLKALGHAAQAQPDQQVRVATRITGELGVALVSVSSSAIIRHGEPDAA